MKRFLIGICLGFGIWSLGFAQQAEAVEHKWEVGQGTGLTTTEFVVKDARVGINAIRLAIDAGGNVGIGTTSPGAKLEVKSSGTPFNINYNNTGAVGMIALYRSDVLKATNILEDDDSYSIYVNNDRRMTVKTTGNVGIGTTSPTQKLQVAGKVRFDIDRQNITTNTTEQGVRMQQGWGYMQGIDQKRVDGYVTFEAAFDAAPIVYATTIGAINSVPTKVEDFTAGAGDVNAPCVTEIHGISKTGFYITLIKTAGLASNWYWGYSWVAIGQKQ